VATVMTIWVMMIMIIPTTMMTMGMVITLDGGVAAPG
jgi:hypothetical protein